MKRFLALFGMLLIMAFLSRTTFACECSWEDQNMNREKAKSFYLEKFRGAVFKGKVIKITEELSNRNNSQVIIRRITIQVKKHYFGVKKQRIIIYSTKGGCGINDFEKGKMFFFVAHLENDKLVSIVCDYLFKDYFTENELTKIFSKAKTTIKLYK